MESFNLYNNLSYILHKGIEVNTFVGTLPKKATSFLYIV